MSSLTDSAVAAFQLITHQDPMLWSVVARSLWVSVWATAIAGVLGVCFGAWLAVVRFQARGALLILLNTLLVVYLLLSRSGPLGHLGWLFSLKAMVLAQSVLVFPVVAALTRQCIEDADRQHGEQLQSIGAGIGLRSLLLVWDERYVFLTIVITAFGRAISEVGAVMVVGGNIEGFTRVMTTAIALETSKGDLPLALALGLVLLVVVLVLNVWVGVIKSWRLRVDGATAQPLQKGWV
jgi:tungstate transport system permease protein